MNKLITIALALFVDSILPVYPLFADNPAYSICVNELDGTPFEVIKGLLIVKAEINGEEGNFILDTGSPMMILNSRPGESQKSSHAKSLSGEISGQWEKIDEFSWAGIQKFGMEALCTDICHLETIAGKPLRGLIGYEFFGNLDLLLDFERQVLRLMPPGFSDNMEGGGPALQIPFTIVGHLAVIEAKIGEASFRLGLDTGAGINLLDSSRKKDIDKNLYIPAKDAKIVGLDQARSSYSVVEVLATSVAGKSYPNMQYLLTDISNLHNLSDNHVDGLLGYPFFQSGRFTINYTKKIISIWQ
ncbi:MAG: hypothetical protein H6577_13885 [Lewinellaceae bacterium]|nr:hypothetical protein [Saprospiraceae bacterium]MCB9339217.1 hypothetical protein [Lewinellaceae bacterium]